MLLLTVYLPSKIVTLLLVKNEKKENIVLVGFMGCGKSTLGKKLAKEFEMTFVDMDAEIEKDQGMRIADIFKVKGEPYFRQLETNLLKTFKAQSNLIISTGGGAPCFNGNMELINSIGKSIYIQVAVPELVQRLKGDSDNRPLIAKMEDTELANFVKDSLKKRERFYLKAHSHNESSFEEIKTVIF